MATQNGDTIPDDSSTPITLTIGGSVTGFVNSNNDKDWYSVDLIAGRTYVFNSGISGIVDPIRGTSMRVLNADS